MKTALPPQATSFFGPLAGFNWAKATLTGHGPITDGLLKINGQIGIVDFPADKFSGRMLLYVSKADIDTDGPGGGKKDDPCWQSETSERWSNGVSVDSRTYPGVVVPPWLEAMGVKMGDFGIVYWRTTIVAVQAYDVGPRHKIGEMSIYAGRKAGIVAPNVSDHAAATHGNDVTTAVTLLLPGSGPGHAILPELIVGAVRSLIPQIKPEKIV